MPTIDVSQAAETGPSVLRGQWRLRLHSDYQRVYASSRKRFSPLMSFFVLAREATHADAASAASSVRGPRVGLTAGKVLGNAVQRNRIKRRMREAVRQSLPWLTADVDVVLHPRKRVVDVPFETLVAEVAQVFRAIQSERERCAGASRDRRQVV
jgi:ribonuclease P protein component